MPEGQRLKVFLSYSRRDSSEFADELVGGLELAGFAPFFDRHDIAAGEDWEARLGGLMQEADTVVLIVSPEAVKSKRCAWEVDKTLALSKRLLPVIHKPVVDADIPEQLRRRQFVDFSKGSSITRPLRELADALRRDLEWIREHTRLGELSARWQLRNRPDSLLLRGDDLDAAKTWVAKRRPEAPEITNRQHEYISASEKAEEARLIAQRKQLEEMAAAQDARAKALHAAEEALNRTIRLQRRQAWVGTVIVLVLGIIGWWAYGVIGEKRAVAREAEREDIRGQIVAYAAAFGSMEMDVVKGLSTSPYTTPLVQKLRQKKNLLDAIVDAHQQVLDLSEGRQRPLVSTSMNGQIYLYRQPATRRKRALLISADDPGREIGRLQGPPHDVEAVAGTLTDSGFSQTDVIILHNPDRRQIEDAIADIAQLFSQQSSDNARGRLAEFMHTSIIRVGFVPIEEEFTAPKNTLLLFFFSGHGVNAGSTEYIIPRLSPVLTNLNGPRDFENYAIRVNWLKQTLERSAAASVIILDTHFPTISFGKSS
jgi:hypothetical protein